MNHFFVTTFFTIALSPSAFAFKTDCQNSKIITKNISALNEKIFSASVYCPWSFEMRKDYYFDLSKENTKIISTFLKKIAPKVGLSSVDLSFRTSRHKLFFTIPNKQKKYLIVIANEAGAERVHEFIKKYDKPRCHPLM